MRLFKHRSTTKLFILFFFLLAGFLSLSNLVNAQRYSVDIYDLPFNTNKSEFGPAFYKGGIAFIREGGKSLYKSDNSNKRKEQTDVYYSLPGSGESSWSPAKKFDVLINTEFDETSIIFYNGGRNFMITRNNISEDTREKMIEEKISKGLYSKNTKVRAKEIKENKKVTKLSIAGGRVSNSIGTVSQIQDLDINSLDYAISDPAVSPDKKVLIVSSNKPGGEGNFDLYMYKREKGKWVDMKPLSSLINSQGNEVTPFILDYYTMFFASDRNQNRGKSGNRGGLDIYRVDGWNTSKPSVKILPSPINTAFDDFGLIMDPSHKFGYFTSDRTSKKGKFSAKKNYNIYKYIHIAKTLELLLVDAAKKPMKNKKITLRRTTDKIIGSFITNENGKIKVDVYKKLDYVFSHVTSKGPAYLLWNADDMAFMKTFQVDENVDEVVPADKKVKDPLLAAMELKKKSQVQMKKNDANMNKSKESEQITNNNISNNSNVLKPINNDNFKEIGDPNKNGERTTKEQEKELIAIVEDHQKNSATIIDKKIASTSSTTLPQNKSKKKESKRLHVTAYSNKSGYANMLMSDDDNSSDLKVDAKTKSNIIHKLVNKEIKLKEMIKLDGKVSNERGNPLVNAKVIIEKDKESALITVERTNNEGVFGANLERFDKYWVSVLHSKDFSVPSYVDASASDDPNIYIRTTTVKLKVNDKVPLTNMTYRVSKTGLSRGGNVELRALARFLKLPDNMGLKLQINSYTDATGPKWLNLKLSQKRANQAKTYLIKMGVSAERIIAQGKGETNFLNQCVNNVPCSLKQHALNRRSEFIIK